MQISYSRIGCFNKCPYQYKLKYVDKLKANRPIEPADPLIVGSAMHEGIENGVEAGIAYYKKHMPIYDDLAVHEEMKLRALIPKVQQLLPENCIFELKIDFPEFVGYVDCLAPTENEGEYDLFDFKYTNPRNDKRYLNSEQLEVYKYYLERMGYEIRSFGYVIVPKTMIRQKKTETLLEFRKRLESTLDTLKPFIAFPDDDSNVKVIKFFNDATAALTAEQFPKYQSNLCDWCDYKSFCFTDGKDTSMILPSAKRRDISKMEFVKVWVYGEPFTGKTTFANQFPNPLMLNTDGNIKFVDAPYISLKDTLITEGRITKTIHGWETLKEAIEELEKGDHEFKTVVLDLAEGAYELNRSYIYEKRGWEHESDDSFRAWDIVRKEFFDCMRRLTNLPMNVVLISHEDVTKDITARSGDKVTSIKPNIPDKVAKVVAGMVDVVGRVVVRDGQHLLTFKSEEFIFGGGRLELDVSEIPLTYSEFADLLGIDAAAPTEIKAAEKAFEISEPEPNVEEVAEAVEAEPTETPEAPAPRKRRGRPAKVEAVEEAAAPSGEAVEQPVKRTRKRRVKED